MTKSGEKIYTSDQLDRCWGFGYASVGEVTFGSAAYVARYHLKKVGSVVSDNHYVNPLTGEMLRPEYVTMSRRPGIGKGFLDKFADEIYPHDYIFLKGGVKVKPPPYYDDKFKLTNPKEFSKIRQRRVKFAQQSVDNSFERLREREVVHKARLKLKKRSYENE